MSCYLHGKLLERWLVLDSFQECLVTNTIKKTLLKKQFWLTRQNSRKVLRLSCVSLLLYVSAFP